MKLNITHPGFPIVAHVHLQYILCLQFNHQIQLQYKKIERLHCLDESEYFV